jgi:hypothetical protein
VLLFDVGVPFALVRLKDFVKPIHIKSTFGCHFAEDISFLENASTEFKVAKSCIKDSLLRYLRCFAPNALCCVFGRGITSYETAKAPPDCRGDYAGLHRFGSECPNLTAKPADVAIAPPAQGGERSRSIQPDSYTEHIVTIPVFLTCDGVADHFPAPYETISQFGNSFVGIAGPLRDLNDCVPPVEHFVTELGNGFDCSRKIRRRIRTAVGQYCPSKVDEPIRPFVRPFASWLFGNAAA